jgi:putative ABC transport system permease protein
MIKSYIKIAWRSMMKNKFFSIVNIFGLAVGLTCCMLIALYLHYETSYDNYHKNIDNLYQVGTTNIKKGEKDDKSPYTAPPVSAALKQEFPEIAASTRLLNLFTDDVNLVQYTPAGGDKKSFLEGHGFLTDSSFFKIFTYNFIEGNANIALANPNSAVISETMAKKIFGSQPAINKLLHISSNMNGDNDYTVTGVFRPVNRPWTNISKNRGTILPGIICFTPMCY